MNVYDFDNTIYDGESTVDYYFFLLRKYPKLLEILPTLFVMLIKYKLCLVTYSDLLKKAEKYAIKLKPYFGEELVSEFWDKNEHKIKKFYLDGQRDSDVILSASCGFLLREIARRKGIKNLICSEIDAETGEILKVCFRDEKVKIFKQEYPDDIIDEFYTDSMNDEPMFSLAKRVFFVKNNKIEELKL